MTIKSACGTLLLVATQAFAADEGVLISLNFRDAPLSHVVQFYEDVSGQTVTVERAEYPVVTIRPDRRLSISEALSSIETNLESIGIMFKRTDAGVAIYPDTQRMPEQVERVLYSALPSPSEKESDQELQDKLIRDQMETIRKGLPQLPEKNK